MNKTMTKRNPIHAFWLFLFSASNLAGIILGLTGLALYFTGYTGRYWPLVVLILYGIGIMIVPPPKVVDFKIGGATQGLTMPTVLADLSHSLEGKLPDQIKGKVDGIISTLLLIAAEMKHNPDYKNRYRLIEQFALKDLPSILQNYLNLPAFYANYFPVKKGKTPRVLLAESLTRLEMNLKDILLTIYQEDEKKITLAFLLLEEQVRRSPFNY